MDALEAIESLIWKKKELKNLDGWLMDLEVNSRPVNGIHWRKLKKVIDGFALELQEEIRSMEMKIKESVGEIDIDI